MRLLLWVWCVMRCLSVVVSCSNDVCSSGSDAGKGCAMPSALRGVASPSHDWWSSVHRDPIELFPVATATAPAKQSFTSPWVLPRDAHSSRMRSRMTDFDAQSRRINRFATLTSHFQTLIKRYNPLQQQRKKILILMSDTGGGHRASAQAIDEALGLQFANQFDVQILDIWTHYGAWPYNQCVPSYRFLGKHPMLWRAAFAYGSFFPTRKLLEWMSSRSSYEAFSRAIRTAQPDLVVSVHPLCQHLPLRIVQEMNAQPRPARIPFVTVVTDLASAHVTWFDRRVDLCIVPSEEVQKLAQRAGIPSEKIMLKGLPVRSSFWSPLNPLNRQSPRRLLSSSLFAANSDELSSDQKQRLKAKLGLDTQRRVVLLMGGGDGVGALHGIAHKTLKALTTMPIASQLVVVCGHNRQTRQVLQRKLHSTKQVDVQIRGFTKNVDEFMAASDCLVTKAGPGTIAEAMIRGLPLIISSFLPGQETGNVNYCVEKGFGVYTGSSARQITSALTSMLCNDSKLNEMRRLARLHSRPDATEEIARAIGHVLLPPFKP